jgi:hypothetical protein
MSLLVPAHPSILPWYAFLAVAMLYNRHVFVQVRHAVVAYGKLHTKQLQQLLMVKQQRRGAVILHDGLRAVKGTASRTLSWWLHSVQQIAINMH